MQSRHGVRCRASSIVNSLRVPSVEMDVVINAIKRVAGLDIPFFPIPHRRPPPVAGGTPGAARRDDASMHAVESDPDGNALAKLDGGFERRAEEAEGEGNGGMRSAFIPLLG